MNFEELTAQREILRLVIDAARQFAHPSLYRIRKLRGGNFWAFLPHQVIRKIVLDVAPDAIFSMGDVKIDPKGNNAFCECFLEIAHHKKSAIASVPIETISDKGNIMDIGSLPDRLWAESVKNAAEAWEFGAHLDDQVSVFWYLKDNVASLSTEMKGLLNSLEMSLKSNFREDFNRKGKLKKESDIPEDTTLKDIPKRNVGTPKPKTPNTKKDWVKGQHEANANQEQLQRYPENWGKLRELSVVINRPSHEMFANVIHSGDIDLIHPYNQKWLIAMSKLLDEWMMSLEYDAGQDLYDHESTLANFSVQCATVNDEPQRSPLEIIFDWVEPIKKVYQEAVESMPVG